ncbi:MAG: ASCH domain-containing protein [Clostridia bacterium]|nr:ASCH domain-containing protein [Clostridia bacterium]
MTATQLWERFCAHIYKEENRTLTDEYESWAFGDDPDVLAALVLSGTKTATASVYELYAAEGEELPRVGAYSVILNTADEALCVIRNTRVYIAPFDEIGEEQALREGEGDRTLAYWRAVHRAFFTEELTAAGLTFHEKISVVCEEFEVVFRAEDL